MVTSERPKGSTLDSGVAPIGFLYTVSEVSHQFAHEAVEGDVRQMRISPSTRFCSSPERMITVLQFPGKDNHGFAVRLLCLAVRPTFNQGFHRSPER